MTMEDVKRKGKTPVVIKCDMLDHQTPASCIEIVIKIIKYIMYQKQQIPYPYEHLKYIAGKRAELRNKNASSSSIQEGIKAEKMYRKASETFDALEEIFQHIGAELRNCDTGYVKEIMVVLGSTPVSPKEIYRIHLPPITSYCEGKNTSSNKSLLQFMRCVLTSEDLHELISKPLGPTNVYVLLKKPAGRKSEWFLPKHRYNVPVHCNQAVFSFISSSSPMIVDASCHISTDEIQCKRTDNGCFTIFQDSKNIVNEMDIVPEEQSDHVGIENMQWYQAQIIVKGFKDTFSKKLHY